MLPAEEIVTAAIRAAMAAYIADETALRSIYDGYPTARVDTIVAAMASATSRPTVMPEYSRAHAKTPLVLVQTGSQSAEVLPGGDAPDMAYSEIVEVVVYDSNPAKVQDIARLVRACLLVARAAYILAKVDCLGIVYVGASDIAPTPAPSGAKDLEIGLNAEDLLSMVLTYKVLSEETPEIPASLEDANLIDEVAVIREGFTDYSYDPPVEGGVSFSRGE